MMKDNLEKLTLAFISLIMVLGFGVYLYKDKQEKVIEAQKIARVEQFKPTVMHSIVATKDSYKNGDALGATFTFTRHSDAPSTLTRDWTCTKSGFTKGDSFAIAGSSDKMDEIQTVTVDPFIVIPAELRGTCQLKFSQKFDITLEGVKATKTVNYKLSGIVIKE